MIYPEKCVEVTQFYDAVWFHEIKSSGFNWLIFFFSRPNIHFKKRFCIQMILQSIFFTPFNQIKLSEFNTQFFFRVHMQIHVLIHIRRIHTHTLNTVHAIHLITHTQDTTHVLKHILYTVYWIIHTTYMHACHEWFIYTLCSTSSIKYLIRTENILCYMHVV